MSELKFSYPAPANFKNTILDIIRNNVNADYNAFMTGTQTPQEFEELSESSKLLVLAGVANEAIYQEVFNAGLERLMSVPFPTP
jgi:hypothetical protein